MSDDNCMNCVSCGASHEEVAAKERDRIVSMLRAYSRDFNAPESFREAWRLMALLLDPAKPFVDLESVQDYVARRQAEAKKVESR